MYGLRASGTSRPCPRCEFRRLSVVARISRGGCAIGGGGTIIFGGRCRGERDWSVVGGRRGGVVFCGVDEFRVACSAVCL